ncbi:MAG: YkgJ family cysteine cluster protein [Acidobacteria bacterium]|nr:MAG: YkgJ family cysteine cluster protein [Acidobacteriota bacterium]
MPREPVWYSNGLRFSCHQCNNCCRGAQPGWVYVSPAQIVRLERFVELSPVAFKERYLTQDEDKDPVLRLKPNGDCIFWENGCTVYAARPRQCRTFPFWPETLESPEAWKELRTFCHGVDQGRLYALSEIKSTLKGRATPSEGS